jgi:hypothetical protein
VEESIMEKTVAQHQVVAFLEKMLAFGELA